MTHSNNTQPTLTNQPKATSVSPLDQSGSSKNDAPKSKRKAVKVDMYQKITDQVIAALENGVKPWVCPWEVTAGQSGMPTNHHTKSIYSGINILLLWSSAAEHCFSSSAWMTFKQAKEQGGSVRRGEKGTQIIYYKLWEKENDQGEKEQIPMLKTYTVFNLDQIDGLEDGAATHGNIEPQGFDALEPVEEFLKGTGADILERGDSAFYCPSTDQIVLPERFRFSQATDFYATAAHELTHWTGHKNRLDRKGGKTFGDSDYAFEELVGELGSAFLMADLNITGDMQHDSYIASWLEKLRNDKRFIFKAASAASKAHQYLVECVAQSEQPKAA